MIFNEVIGCFVFLLCVTLPPVCRSVGRSVGRFSRIQQQRGVRLRTSLSLSRFTQNTKQSTRLAWIESNERTHPSIGGNDQCHPLSISSLNPKPFVDSAADNRCINVQQRRYDMLIPHVPESRLSIHPSISIEIFNGCSIHTHTFESNPFVYF